LEKKMKHNLAEFKRRMKVGSKWEFSASWHPEKIIRTCTHAQTNAFALTSPRTKSESSWLDYPPARECIWINNHDGRICLRLEGPYGHLVYREVTNEN
jgi:hypothetical protein